MDVHKYSVSRQNAHMYQRSYYNNTIKVHIHNFVAMADNIFILS